MEIDVDELRDYMVDYCGTAAFSDSPAAVLDVVDIERMDGYELRKSRRSRHQPKEVRGLKLQHHLCDRA